MSRDFRLIVHGDRADTFRSVFGTDTVCVTSPVPTWVELPGKGRSLVHFLDLDCLTPEQWERLVEHTASTWGYSRQEAEEGLRKEGMPLLADDVTIAVHNPRRWLT